MEKSYQEFLRRRGIWHVIEECKQEGKTFLSVSSFVERLSQYFNANKTFAEWDQPENQDIDLACKRNAWIAVLNEMYNARRSTSLASMGLLSLSMIQMLKFAVILQANSEYLTPKAKTS